MELSGVTFDLICVRHQDLRGVTVAVRVHQLDTHPTLAGTRIEVDTYEGYYDIITAWAGRRGDNMVLTIDYSKLD